MVRNYRPRNLLDPGSKLPGGTTAAIIHLLMEGMQSSVITAATGVSKNTVTAVAARFRRKLRTSLAIRRVCFEPFYNGGMIGKPTYIHLLEIDQTSPSFFEEVGRCALRCPSQFMGDASAWVRFAEASGQRFLNLLQTQRYLEQKAPAGMPIRTFCDDCQTLERGLFKPRFYPMLGHYLRVRNLRASDVEDHYLLFVLYNFIHDLTQLEIGHSAAEDESILPDEIDWPALDERYRLTMFTNAHRLFEPLIDALFQDPLE